MKLTKDNAHKALSSAVVPRLWTQEEALLWMVLIHTHEVHLRPGVLVDDDGSEVRDEVPVLPPTTQHMASEILASLWRGSEDARLRNPIYWYRKYTDLGPIEDIADANASIRRGVGALRNKLAAAPHVVLVTQAQD